MPDWKKLADTCRAASSLRSFSVQSLLAAIWGRLDDSNKFQFVLERQFHSDGACVDEQVNEAFVATEPLVVSKVSLEVAGNVNAVECYLTKDGSRIGDPITIPANEKIVAAETAGQFATGESVGLEVADTGVSPGPSGDPQCSATGPITVRFDVYYGTE